MQKILMVIAALLFAYLAYRYLNMKPVDKKPEKVAEPIEDDTVPTVPIKEDTKEE